MEDSVAGWSGSTPVYQSTMGPSRHSRPLPARACPVTGTRSASGRNGSPVGTGSGPECQLDVNNSSSPSGNNGLGNRCSTS
jgi:hypothetical protein